MSTPDLDAIQNRSDDAMMHESLEPGSYAEIAWHSARDVPALIAYARDLEARIGRVEKLADSLAIDSFHETANSPESSEVKADVCDSIRAALTATDVA